VSDEVIGRSVQGRPIALARIGDPEAPRKVLVVGCIHGNEPAGRGIVADLMRASPAPEFLGRLAWRRRVAVRFWDRACWSRA